MMLPRLLPTLTATLSSLLLASAAGAQQFGPELVLTAGKSFDPTDIRAADLDGDGDLDVLTADSSGRVAWHRNLDGLGSMGPQLVITFAAQGAWSVFAADLDGDGDLDVLTASLFDDEIEWHENTDGAGTFGPEQFITNLAAGAESVFAADLDGDGDQDVLSASSLDDEVATGVEDVGSVSAADLDGDGDPDVLAVADFADAVWHANDGLGSFGPTQAIASESNLRAVVAADLDGDGDRDVLAASGSTNMFAPPGEVAWYANQDGLGSFGPAEVVLALAVGEEPQFPLAADLDGDGDQDVAASLRTNTTGELFWHANQDGLGGFGPKQVLDAFADPFAGPFARAVPADLDADGDLDLLAGVFVLGLAVWYENADGQGSFGPPQTLGTGIAGVLAADLDEDGDLDVLGSSPSDAEIVWFENLDGSGAFGPEQLVASAAEPASADAAADLDGDGDLDVLSTASLVNKLLWYENLVCCALDADTDTLSLAAGGTQDLALDAGVAKASQLYWLLTTAAGASPGVSLAPPPLKVPLNPGGLLLFTLLNPNLLVVGSLDLLDGSGAGAASLTLPAGLDPSLAGTTLHHAYLVLELPGLGVSGVSHAAALLLAP